GPRARMRKILLDAAQRLMAQGITPSVAELAEHAQVSRATAYRYFPSQSALIAAVVDESLGPILAWDSAAPDAATRVDELLRFAYPRLQAHEAPLRAAIQVSLQQHADASAGRAPAGVRCRRGRRWHPHAVAATPGWRRAAALRALAGADRRNEAVHPRGWRRPARPSAWPLY
ncbi:TetR/AcrR family transcriptional regulator, partial [Achromobacter xylosoxidans]